MKIRAIATLTLALSLAAGCASQYKLPEGNQPAAVVKIKTAFDAKKANGLVPLLTTAPSLRMSVSLAEGKKNYQVMNKQLTEAADAKGVITSIEAFHIHPDRPVVLTVYTGQVSLGQYALAGVGAMFAATLMNRAGWPLALAMPAGALLTAPVGVLFASRMGYPIYRRLGFQDVANPIGIYQYVFPK